MIIRRSIILIFLGIVFLSNAALPSLAKDQVAFLSPEQAYRMGIAAYRAEHFDKALPPLSYAAKNGIVSAQILLARLYSAGEKVVHDAPKAFQYYRQIAETGAEISPNHPISGFVGEAFLELGKYYQAGIPELGIEKNDHKASRLIRYAATYFRNSDAQYRLALVYLKGIGVEKNPRHAARWLNLASKKQHPEALATLAWLLWEGKVVKKSPAKALALMNKAAKLAKPANKKKMAQLLKKMKKFRNVAKTEYVGTEPNRTKSNQAR